jgi:ribosomal protein L11 methyltransferase
MRFACYIQPKQSHAIALELTCKTCCFPFKRFQKDCFMLEGLHPNNPTHIMRLVTKEREARAIALFLSECFDPDETAVAAFENEEDKSLTPDWLVETYFRTPPDEAQIRDLLKLSAGDKAASEAIFTQIQSKDWVKSSLDGLKPVRAGRFIVHGSHNREGLPANTINLEIEAALAFGTGHHGTTYGCLLAINNHLKKRRIVNALDVGTGTGVLAMAIAKAVKLNVLLSDIDPVSVAAH